MSQVDLAIHGPASMYSQVDDFGKLSWTENLNFTYKSWRQLIKIMADSAWDIPYLKIGKFPYFIIRFYYRAVK